MATPNQNTIRLQPGDVLLVTDIQNDFLPGGSLGSRAATRWCRC